MPISSVTDFKSQHLTKLEQRLLALDPNVANTTDLIIQSALLKAYGTAANFSTVANPSQFVGLLEAMPQADLNVYLQNPSNVVNFTTMMNNTIANTALTAGQQNSAAWATVANSATAMAALASNASAMATLASSSTAMAAFFANATACAAVMDSTTAWNVLVGSSTAMTAMVASATAWNTLENKATPLAAFAASLTAIRALRLDATALSIVNSKPNIKTTIFNSPLKVTYTKPAAGWAGAPMVIHTGAGLYIRGYHPGGYQGSGTRIDGAYLGGNLALNDAFWLTKYSTELATDNWYYAGDFVAYIIV
jgi:hypothetical protein